MVPWYPDPTTISLYSGSTTYIFLIKNIISESVMVLIGVFSYLLLDVFTEPYREATRSDERRPQTQIQGNHELCQESTKI